ncbi:MAG: endonuclease/exonuclease/phosphatase family protein [Roseobacter sp.]|jgi:endonuclease/exonuclease/phosphatase family metal-dependent hydrolase|nr:endonuclease/exonuclease/phosphatase family protein [Roseobacter sp.]
MQARQLRCATWNVHRAKGIDGHVDPGRVMAGIEQALAPRNLQVLALQEADGECRPHARIFDMDRIATHTGLTYVHDDSLRWGPGSDGFLGTILFLDPALHLLQTDVIDLPGHCHRGAVSVEALYETRPVRIMSTHLSLFQPLRIVQMRIIGQYLRRRPPMQTILLGDLNEWRPWGGLMFHRRLVGRVLSGPIRRTFPSTRPILPLDRILTDAPGEVRRLRTIKSAEVALASDHLPLEAIVTIP